MLTIAKLRSGPGSVDYYVNSVANGLEDYYAGKGEAPGQWIGGAAERLGLDGQVDGGTLAELMEGRLPGAQSKLGGIRSNRTPGWDLTWSAPKSVSVLYGLSDETTSRRVVAAHDDAVSEALKYLDRWAVVSRRTVDGEVRGVETRGMVVAGFRHRTSRNMDPQLHTHTLVPNVVERNDGTWGAIDSRVFYRHAKTAGYVYQAVLRAGLTNSLGVEWGAITKGFAEVTAVPAAINDLFSSRRKEIEAELDARGASSIKAGRTAALRTRATKAQVAGTDVLRQSWRSKVIDANLDLDAIGQKLDGVDSVLDTVSRRQRRLVNGELMGESGLTKSKASFNRGDVVRAWCENIDTRTVGVDADLLDNLVATTVGDNRSVLLGTGDPLHGVADPRRWSTADLVAIETSIVDNVANGRHAGIATVPRHTTRRTIDEHPALTDEQTNMVEALTSDGHRIDAVIGVAGSGKTFALGVANDIWTAGGYTPIGLAFAGKAARGLQTGSGIPSTTIDKLLHELDRPDHPALPERAVLVLDEAGMIPTRKLATLLDHVRPDTKVVLVGDHHQLPEIGAGGVLRSIAERFDDIPTLTENRRQQHVAERKALSELRDGDIRTGLDWYVNAGRVTPCDDMNTAREQLVDAWWNDHAAGHTDQLMMAERRTDVARLNDLARDRFQQHGRLSTERLEIAERDYAVGDRVMFLRNDYRLGVRNGERGSITAIDPDEKSLTVHVNDRTADTSDDLSIAVPHEYIASGDLEWGYAATVHKNQGATSEYSYLLATDVLYRELGYTALSRGRVDNRMWTVTDAEPDIDLERAHTPEDDEPRYPIADLVRAMERSTAQHLAIDEANLLPEPIEPATIDIVELIKRRDEIGNQLFRSAPLRVSDELDNATRRLAIAERRLDEADDRDWHARSESVAEARTQLDEYAAMQARFDDWSLRHRGDVAERRSLDNRIASTLTAEVVAVEDDPPHHLIETIGYPPIGIDARTMWRAAAVEIELDARTDHPEVGAANPTLDFADEMDLA